MLRAGNTVVTEPPAGDLTTRLQNAPEDHTTMTQSPGFDDVAIRSGAYVPLNRKPLRADAKRRIC